MIPLFKPSLDSLEEKALIKTLRSNWLGSGPQTLKLEKKIAELTHAKYAIALNSASAALHLSFLTAIKPGDEVISPSLTFVAANQAILHAGGKIVFADVDEDTLSADPQDIINKITKKTKAIIVMHYGGHPVNLNPLVKICRQKNIILIEDCAHAMGSYYKNKHVGSFGNLGCFSFAAIKNITSGDGGMVVTKNKAQADKIRLLSWSGISSSTWGRYQKNKKTYKWQYQVKELGFKYQMNDIAASIGLVQLKKLSKNNKKRFQITKRYNQAFKNINWLTTPIVKSWAKSSHHNYVIKVPAEIRNQLIDYLSAKGIASNVHYLPNHHYPMFNKFPANVPVTEKVWQEIVLLPIFPDLTIQDQNKVINAVKAFKC